MFAYCRNNPVSRKDVSGTDDIEVVDLDGNPTIDEDDICGASSANTQSNSLATYMGGVSDYYQSPQRGVPGHGWHGDSSWNQNVRTVASGGTHTELKGGVPSQTEAMQLIDEAGGSYMRVEGGHCAPNPHTYAHINYVVNGVKGTVRILAVEQEGVIYRDGHNWR